MKVRFLRELGCLSASRCASKQTNRNLKKEPNKQSYICTKISDFTLTRVIKESY